MRPGKFFITIIFNLVFAVFLAVQASCATAPSIATQTVSTPDARDALMGHVASQADAGELVSTIKEPDAVQGTPMQDGLKLLTTHCAGCHATTWFDKIEKPRAEWDLVLERMKSLGVQLSNTEKDILLDYLAIADKP